MDETAGRIGKTDMKTLTAIFLRENPNATDHSTIVGNAMHACKAIAYDVAIGWVNPSEITAEYLEQLREFSADWRYLYKVAGHPELRTIRRDKGFFKGLQLFRTYTKEHLRDDAPGIVDKRKSNFIADIH